MPDAEIRPFSEEHLDAAAALLRQRHIDLAHASVAPAARGSGVSLALVEYALEWARGEGFASMTVDWREVNLLASRFWPRRGFRPTFYRLYRHLP